LETRLIFFSIFIVITLYANFINRLTHSVTCAFLKKERSCLRAKKTSETMTRRLKVEDVVLELTHVELVVRFVDL